MLPSKAIIQSGGRIKIFHNKQKLKENTTTKPPLQKILKGILHTGDENNHSHENMGNIKSLDKNRQVIRQ
jgi:hypothetical protein